MKTKSKSHFTPVTRRTFLRTGAVLTAGVAALSLPVGRTRSQLPVGLQLIAPAFAEERLLSVAAACERAAP